MPQSRRSARDPPPIFLPQLGTVVPKEPNGLAKIRRDPIGNAHHERGGLAVYPSHPETRGELADGDTFRGSGHESLQMIKLLRAWNGV